MGGREEVEVLIRTIITLILWNFQCSNIEPKGGV